MPAIRFRVRRVKKRSTLSRWYSKIIKTTNRAISRSVFAIRVRRSFRALPSHLRTAVIGVVVIAVAIPAVFLYPNSAHGASYTFAQTDWQGGTDSDTGAEHATNQTGWTKYSSISNMSGTTSAGNAVLTTASYTATDDGTLTSTGAATGGGFSSGTISSTAVSGSGASGAIALDGSATAINNWSTAAAGIPGTVTSGGYMIRNGTDDTLYLIGGGTTGLYKYTISSNLWTTLTAIPAAVGIGATMLRDGSSDDIYITRGGSTTAFYKYSISGNSWTTLATSPAGFGASSNMIRNASDNDIYAAQGGGSSAFYRYSISGNTWTTLTAMPGAYGAGGKILRNSTDNDIYALQGNGSSGFWRYSISGNTWTSLAVFSALAYDDASIIRNGSDDLFYATKGAATGGFYSYSIAGNVWTTLTSAPGNIHLGSKLIRNGSSNDVYLTQGNGTGFYRYSISGNSWTTLTVTPGAIGNGSFFSWASSENTIYISRGAATNGFFAYSVSGGTWTSSYTSSLTATLGTVGAGAQMLRNGTDDEVYVTQGGATGFYRYSISGNTWTTLATVPFAVGAGSSMIRNSNDDHIYLIRGGALSGFFRYSISGNTWTTLYGTPGAAGAGSTMIRAGSSDDIYLLRGGSTTSFYRYTIAGNTWTTLAVVPANTGVGATIIRNGTDDDIYALQGNTGTGLYRYSITGNSWTTLTIVPGTTGDGAAMLRNGADNDIYILRGGGNNSFYRYSISGNSYTALTVVPTASNTGGTMLRNGSDNDIYIFPGSSATFYKYSITGNSYTAMPNVPGSISTGGGAIRNSANENNFYILQGAGTAFHKFTINQVVYNASGTFTSATIDTAGVTAYGNASWTISLPTGTTATVATRTSSDSSSWSAWSAELSTAAGSAITSNTDRYIQYRLTLGTSDSALTPSISDVTLAYTAYNTSGNLVSSIFNASDATNVIGGLAWTEDASLPSGTSVTISLRAAASSGGVSGASWSDFTNATANCSKSTGTVTCTSAAIPVGLLTNAQYFQYKITSASTNGGASPTIGSVTTTYVVNAPPELQNVTATQGSDGLVTISYDARDPDTASGSPANQGHVTPSFEYWNGSSYSAITTLAVGDTSNKAVNADGTTWTTHTATWTATTDYSGQYMNNTAKIRVTLNDNEAANNTANSESATFTLDTKVPASASVLADYSTANSGNSYLATLTLAASDDTALTMMISTTSNHASPLFSGAYATSKTVSVGNTPDSPDTIYVRFTDAKGNITNVSTTPPARGTNLMIQDISNITTAPAEYRLFVAWKAVSPTGFGSYKVYRSTDQSVWSLLTTIATAGTNYYTDSTVSADTAYYYRVTILNSNSDISFVSATVNGNANGTQDPGEGAGGSSVAPVLSSVTVGSITPTTATVTWDTDQISNSAVSYSTTAALFNTTTSVSSMLDTAAGVGQHSVVLSGLTPNTTYYLRASSTNTTGSTGTASNGGNGYTFTTLSGPAITATGTARTESISNTSATIVWQTSSAADSEVIYSTSPTFASSSTTSSLTMVTDHSVTLTSLSAATQYFFYVQSTDESNNVEQDKNVVDGVARYYSFTTSNDSTAPTISAVSAVAQTTTAVILWTTNESATSQVEYGTTNSYGTSTTLDSTLTTQHSVSLSSLTPGTLYYYRVKTTDTNGNLSTGSEQTFTTGDSTAPVISSVASGSLALTSATITWTTNEQSNSVVEYGTSTAYGSTAGSEVEAVTSHSVTLSSLSANTLYYYRVRSRDASGNLATSDNSGNGYTFTTVADSTAPTISNVTTALVSDTSAIITWTTNEVANAKVEYGPTIAYGSSTIVTASYTTNQTVQITGLTKSTPYFFKVISIDPSTNSTTSDNTGAGYTFTTTADPVAASSGGGGGGGFYPGDVTPPNILDVKINNITSSSARIEWLTDEAANTMVSYNAPNQPAFLEGNSDDSAPTHAVTLTGLEPATTYSFRPISYDAKGNKGTGELSKFTTLGKDGKVIAAPQIGTPPAPATPATPAPATPTPAATSSSLLDTLKTIISNPLLSALPESTLIALLNDLSAKAISPPTIVSNKADVEVKGTVATITWSTDKKTIGVVAYGKIGEPLNEKNQFSIAGNINTYNTDHKVVLDGLDPATTYKYEVQAKAAYGPEAKFVAGTFKTTTELPVISNIKLDSINDNSVTVQWKTNTPTSASVEYTNRDTQVTLAQGDTSLLRDHSITVKDLLSGAPYSLVIKASDEFKNESVSGSVPFTTGKDVLAPEITKVTAESTIYPGKESRVQTIVTWTTNEPGTSQVFYQEGVGVDAKAIELSKDNTLTLAHTVVVTKFAPASIYKFWVVSVDASGNSTRSKDYTILTPQQKETVVDVILKNFEQTFGWTQRLKGGN